MYQLGVRFDVLLGAVIHDLLGVGEASSPRARDGNHAKDQWHLVNLNKYSQQID